MARAVFFGPVGDAAGAAERAVPEDCRTVAEALDALTLATPALGGHRDRLRVAVNGAFVSLDHPLRPGDELSILSPVSGG